jgi:Relaxase/Mobilisation nuclease domain
MPKRLIDARGGKPLLDIASYARPGPARRDHPSHAEIEVIERTVRRTPEVMVKVLSRGGQDLKAVALHIAYLNRGGDVEIETDDGQRLSGKGVERELLEDWDLDLEEHRRAGGVESWSRRPRLKLVHKLMFSMPPGTPPDKVLAAVKNFAREAFGLKHRYAMVLHTDEPHPHVHLVLKVVSEQGIRLNIRKQTLRDWRREFARRLREQGIAANATERAVRCEIRTHKTDGIYRAALRGDSTHARARVNTVVEELLKGDLRVEPGGARLRQTREEVMRGWRAVRDILVREDQTGLAEEVAHFVSQMPAPRTDKERLAYEIRESLPSRTQRERLITR